MFGLFVVFGFLFQVLFISFWFLCFTSVLFRFLFRLVSFFCFRVFFFWVSLFDGISVLVYYVTVYG